MNPRLIVIDGKTYRSIDEMPPDIRAKYEEAMGAMDQNRNGIPDFIEGMFNAPAETITTPAQDAPTGMTGAAPRAAARSQPISTATIEPESSGGWVLALAGITLVGLCLLAAAAGVWYFFLR